MEKILNKINPQNLQVVTESTVSPYFYQVNGDQISFRYVNSKNSPNWSTDSNSHKAAQLLGMYSEADAKKYSIPFVDGGLQDTMINQIGEAWNSTGFYVANIANEAFRTSFAPNVKITLPISGGTGELSGLTSLTLYNAFVLQNNSKTSTQRGPCSEWYVDTLTSENHIPSTSNAGLGFAYDDINNGGENFESGIVHLFTDSITWSGQTSGTTWGTGWSGDSRYTFGNEYGVGTFAQFNGDNRNESVGFLSTISGQITIYHPLVVAALNTGIAVSGNTTSGMTFSTSDCNMVAKDMDSFTELNVTINLEPDTFIQTQNMSALDAKQDGITCDTVNITEFCLYNPSGELMALGMLSKEIKRQSKDFTIIQGKVGFDGGAKDAIYLAGNNAFYTS